MASSDRADQEIKRSNLKTSTDSTQNRIRRADNNLTIRKNKRLESLMKRRITDGSSTGNTENFSPSTAAKEKEGSGDKKAQVVFDPSVLPQMTQAVLKGGPDVAYKATKHFRRILSIEYRPPIQQVIECKIVPRLVAFLKYNANPKLQLEAAWALTNIASGNSDQTKIVVEAGAVPVFISLISSPNTEVSEQAVWGLGNISGDSATMRNLVIEKGLIPPLLQAIESTKSYRMLRHATWTISNLCRGSPPADYEVLRPILPTLTRLLNCKDQEVVQDAAWAFSYLSESRRSAAHSKRSILSDIINCGVAKRMVELLEMSSQDIQIPALRTIGNIATGSDSQTDAIISAGCLRPLTQVLVSGKRGMQKEAAWTISNITAGNISQIQQVIESGAITVLLRSIFTAEFAVRKESAWAVANAVGGSTSKQILALGNTPRLIEALTSMIIGHDIKILLVCMDAIGKILSVGQTQVEKGLASKNQFKSQFEKHSGVKALEDLLEIDNQEVYNKATEIVDTFFSARAAQEDQTLRPVATKEAFVLTAPTTSFDSNFLDDIESDPIWA